MPNSYFKFKEFTISQDKCAMKVGTDGVLLGVWANVDRCNAILDIGTGTGLIALMLAQRNISASIDAIDIEPNAIIQAKENITDSPFRERVNAIETSLQSYSENCTKRYDAIVSNPPFFMDSLKPTNDSRRLARHTDTLPIERLMSNASKLLADDGKLSLVFPSTYTEKLIEEAKEHALYPCKLTYVYPTPASDPKRILIAFSKKEVKTVIDKLTIEIERHVYSDDFKVLAKDFYLKL